LGRLRDEFNHSTDIANAASGEMGSGDVAGALGNFASDWSTKRDQLTKGLDTLSSTRVAGGRPLGRPGRRFRQGPHRRGRQGAKK